MYDVVSLVCHISRPPNLQEDKHPSSLCWPPCFYESVQFGIDKALFYLSKSILIFIRTPVFVSKIREFLKKKTRITRMRLRLTCFMGKRGQTDALHSDNKEIVQCHIVVTSEGWVSFVLHWSLCWQLNNNRTSTNFPKAQVSINLFLTSTFFFTCSASRHRSFHCDNFCPSMFYYFLKKTFYVHPVKVHHFIIS